ncbi:hypothetical protein IGI04_041694 [Brassica rapa subsp. trilocularis]|uniref:Uncharacterized protein n=1 Tax=Brassica rapa subsp. trilocularis TaxID=1813537 RepID=A0ABQ7KVL2_BRACM|nr:hypothetical protein IGI04_041694 [Brassica rapa subsp. trilocularis]
MNSSEYTEEFPRQFRGNTKFGFFGFFSEYTDGIPRKIHFVGIFRRNTEENRNSEGRKGFDYTFLFLGISSEFSEEIPTTIEFSSEFPRKIPRKFRGTWGFKPKTTFYGLNNTYITFIKCLNQIMKSNFGNFLGKFRGNFEETWFLGIFSFNRINQAAKYFAKIELIISEEIPTDIEVYPSGYSDDIFLGIFRGNSDEFLVLGIFSEIHFPRNSVGNLRRKMKFRKVISEDFFRRYVAVLL